MTSFAITLETSFLILSLRPGGALSTCAHREVSRIFLGLDIAKNDTFGPKLTKIMAMLFLRSVKAVLASTCIVSEFLCSCTGIFESS